MLGFVASKVLICLVFAMYSMSWVFCSAILFLKKCFKTFTIHKITKLSFIHIEMHPAGGNLLSDEYSKVIYNFLFQSWIQARPGDLFRD